MTLAERLTWRCKGAGTGVDNGLCCERLQCSYVRPVSSLAERRMQGVDMLACSKI